MIVNNADVAGLVRRIRRFRVETVKSASSQLAATSEADISRALSYFASCNSYILWVTDQPALDLPESSPREYDLGEAEALAMPENEALADLMNMYEVFEIEIGSSQSARQPSGIIEPDLIRINGLLQKMENFVTNYIQAVQPVDLPESAPLRVTTGAGRTGITGGGS